LHICKLHLQKNSLKSILMWMWIGIVDEIKLKLEWTFIFSFIQFP
jgi:hypothetical protein